MQYSRWVRFCWTALLAVAAARAEGGEAASAPASASRPALGRVTSAPAGPGASRREAWPGNTTALVFLWQDASRANQVVAPDGQIVRSCRVVARGHGRLGRFFDMLLGGPPRTRSVALGDAGGGAYVAEGVDEALREACARSGELSIEAVLTPDRAEPNAPGGIVTFAGGGTANFALLQHRGKLVFRLRTDGAAAEAAPVELCTLAAGRPQHVIVSYKAGQTLCCLDGRQVCASAAVRGGLAAWTGCHLVFGDEWDGGRDWAGRLEGIALYSRFVGPEEAQRKYELYRPRLAARKEAHRIVLVGRCTEVTPTPRLEVIHPYRRCLTFCTYQVQQVIEGKCNERRILVGHWAILDGKALDLRRQKGATYRLVVEPESDHPEMVMERKVMVQDDLDLERYYDVAWP